MHEGTLPSQLGGLSNLITMTIDRNKISGRIPSSFGSLISIETISLSENRLSGKGANC
jgi:Leucine-rich repeat (LRR) protein